MPPRVLTNVGWMGGQALAQRVLGMLSSVVLARTLGTEAFGIFSVVNNTASSAYGIFRLSVDAALQVEIAGQKERGVASMRAVAAGFMLLAGAGTVAAATVFATRGWLAATIYADSGLRDWLAFAAPLVLLQCLTQFCYACLAGMHRFADYARVMVICAVLNVLLVAAAGYGWGLAAALYATVAVQLLMLIGLAKPLAAALYRERADLRFRFGALMRSARSLVALGLPFYLAGFVLIPIAYWLQGRLGQAAGIEALGLQRVQLAMCSVITFLPHSISGVVVSSLAQVNAHSGDSSDFDRLSALALKLVWLLTLLLAVGAIAVMPWLIGSLYGKAYLAAVPATQLGCVVAVAAAVVQAAMNGYAAQKRFDLLLWLALLQGAVFLPAGHFLIERYQLYGYVAAELAAQLAVLGLVLARVHRKHGDKGCIVGSLYPGVWVTLPAAALSLAAPGSIATAAAISAAYALLVVAVFCTLVFSPADRAMIAMAVRRRNRAET